MNLDISIFEKMTGKLKEDDGFYLYQVVGTMKINALEKQYLKPEDNLPLFYKEIDEFGIVLGFKRNDEHPMASQIANGLDIASAEVVALLDRIESDAEFLQDFILMLTIGSWEYSIACALGTEEWVTRRLITRIYSDDSDTPIAYEVHSTVDKSIVNSSFSQRLAEDLVSNANN